MPIPDYGFWKGKPLSYHVDGHDDRSPHINLVFKDDHNNRLKAAINVKSQANPSELAYWFNSNFSHPITRRLDRSQYGFQSIDPTDASVQGLALDYLCTRNLLRIQDGRILPFDEDGSDNDILDQLRPILDDAIDQKADIYLYGSRFNTGDGIHDVHMNQGSPGRRFRRDNGKNTDGGMLFRFPDGHWEAVFLAFASQQVPTDDHGQPTPDSKPLAKIISRRGRARL